MAPRLVQAGSGDIRPLVIIYHATAEADPLMRAAVSSATTIVNETLPPGGGRYRSFRSGRLTKLEAVIDFLDKQIGSDVTYWPLVLCGFSEGCQGIRSQLGAGECMSATLAVDGIHMSKPPAASQIDIWREWFTRTGAELGDNGGLNIPGDVERPRAVATCSQIVPPKYYGVRPTLEKITGYNPLEQGGPTELRAVQLEKKTVTVKTSIPAAYTSGNLTILSYAGADGKTHSGQLLVTLPRQLAELGARLGFGPNGMAGPAVAAPAASCPVRGGGEAGTLARVGAAGLFVGLVALGIWLEG